MGAAGTAAPSSPTRGSAMERLTELKTIVVDLG
jgi:hypothetical protein